MNVDKVAAFLEPTDGRRELKGNRKTRRRSDALMRRAETIARKVKPFFRKGDKKDATAAYRAFKAGAIDRGQAVASGCAFGGFR